VRNWYLVDTDGHEHLVVRGVERSSGADGHFSYDTFPPFRDYFRFPKNANISKVEDWICDNFAFERKDLPSPFSGKEKSAQRKGSSMVRESLF
jgi:hypothetical protein